MSDNSFSDSHAYFTLSEYTYDPTSRYRTRIFHSTDPTFTTHPADSKKAAAGTLPNLRQAITAEESTKYKVNENWKGKWDEATRSMATVPIAASSTRNDYMTDDEVVDGPPMSPSSSVGSIDDINIIEQEVPGTILPASRGIQRSFSASDKVDPKGKQAVPLRHSTMPHLKPLFPKLPTPPATTVIAASAPSAFVNFTDYSAKRLAERAREANLSAQHSFGVEARGPGPGRMIRGEPGYALDVSSKAPTPMDVDVEGAAPVAGPSSHPSHSIHSPSWFDATKNAIRARRATINGPPRASEPPVEARAPKRKPEDEPTVPSAPDSVRIKFERYSPPLPIPEYRQPPPPSELAKSSLGSFEPSVFAPPPAQSFPRPPPLPPASAPASSSKSTQRGSFSPAPDPKDTKDSKDSKEPKDEKQKELYDSFGIAMRSGNYDNYEAGRYLCKIHGDHLGSMRSVVRHNESKHLTLHPKCEYCHRTFSRRDAVLRHQRGQKGACRMKPT